MKYSTIRKIHFTGIGGIGMSGIAEVLIQQGFSVQGSDLADSETTQTLRARGARIFIGHDAINLGSCDAVVYSSAVDPNTNVETIAARERNLPVIRRAEMLSEVARLKYCLAVAGTHGKTTTTSMCSLLFLEAGWDPTAIVGGRLNSFGGSNARLGNGDWIILEADEYDRSFLQLYPTMAVITNIEADHLDIYRDLDDIHEAFAEFANNVPFYGGVCLCLDDEGVRRLLPEIRRKVITFGTSPQSATRAVDIVFRERLSSFTLIHNDAEVGRVSLSVPGIHNVRNALAAAAVGLQYGIPPELISSALSSFSGVQRRFDVKGQVSGVTIVDDYAHHPTEIKATLRAARMGWSGRVIAIFQPHTYSRTASLCSDFAVAFDDADSVIITPIYPSREAPIPGVDSSLIVEAIRRHGHRSVSLADNLQMAARLALNEMVSGDIIVVMGAGDVWKCTQSLLQ